MLKFILITYYICLQLVSFLVHIMGIPMLSIDDERDSEFMIYWKTVFWPFYLRPISEIIIIALFGRTNLIRWLQSKLTGRAKT